MKNKTIGVLPVALTVMFLWGSLFPVIKKGYIAFGIDTSFVPDILAFAGLRFAVCGFLILLFALITKRRMKLGPKEWLFVLLAGLFTIILHYPCSYIGLTTTDSGKTALLKQLACALFIPLSSLIIHDDQFSFSKIISATLCMLGIAVLNIGKLGFSFGIGELLIIIASFCSVCGSIFSKKGVETVDAVVLTGYSQFFGGLVLLVIAFSGGGTVSPEEFTALPIFSYICFASILSYTLWNSVMKKGDLSFLFIIKFTEPLFAAFIGALLLHEKPFTWQFAGAFILIVLAISIKCFGNNKEKRLTKDL